MESVTLFVNSYSYDELDIDVPSAEVKRNGHLVRMTRMEFQLLRYFLQHRGTVLSRVELSREVWGYSGAAITRTVDMHVARLRQKIENDPRNPQRILTIIGSGYKFVG
jgi:two-component system, OmpR family, alkaline phosphatase synthesis response regulator PhoP